MGIAQEAGQLFETLRPRWGCRQVKVYNKFLPIPLTSLI
jgi:hypothetical protein